VAWVVVGWLVGCTRTLGEIQVGNQSASLEQDLLALFAELSRVQMQNGLDAVGIDDLLADRLSASTEHLDRVHRTPQYVWVGRLELPDQRQEHVGCRARDEFLVRLCECMRAW